MGRTSPGFRLCGWVSAPGLSSHGLAPATDLGWTRPSGRVYGGSLWSFWGASSKPSVDSWKEDGHWLCRHKPESFCGFLSASFGGEWVPGPWCLWPVKRIVLPVLGWGSGDVLLQKKKSPRNYNLLLMYAIYAAQGNFRRCRLWSSGPTGIVSGKYGLFLVPHNPAGRAGIGTRVSTPSPSHLLLQTLKGSVFPGGSVVKDLPAMQETQVQSLGQEIRWRRKWQSTPEFLPQKYHRQRNLVGYSPWGYKRVSPDWVTKQQNF